MRPVRIELGVHFEAASVVGVANFATVEVKCLTQADGDGLHHRNIEEDGQGFGGSMEKCFRSYGDRDTPFDKPMSEPTAPPTLDATTPTAHVVLHIWPGAFGLASVEATCLAAVLYLQMAIPGQFALEESTTPEYSPNGA